MFRLNIIFFLTLVVAPTIAAEEHNVLPASKKLLAPPTITLSSYDTVICPGQAIVINAYISGQLPIRCDYETTINGTPISKSISSLTNPLKIEVEEAGIYTISSFSNNTDTIDTNIVFIVKHKDPPTSKLVGGGNYCSNETIRPVKAQFSGAPPWELTYQLNFGNAIVDNFTINEVQLLNDEGSIIVRAIKDRHCKVLLRDTAQIKIDEAPVAKIFGEREFCLGEAAIYTTQYQSDYRYRWFVPNGASFSAGEDLQANILPLKWTAFGNFQLELIVDIQNSGCTTGSQFYQVEVHDYPQVIKNFDTVVCFDVENQLRINPTNKAENKVLWLHTGDTIQELTTLIPGTYSYIESIPFGCSDTGNFRVIDKCKPELHVADAFSPNGDGINDLLKISGIYYNLYFYIFTSAGELVYTMTPESDPWDGTSKGTNLPNGTYYWKAEFTDKFKEQYARQGWVTLIR